MKTLKDPLQPLIDFVGDLHTFQTDVQAIQPVTVDLQTALVDFEKVLGAPAEAEQDLADFKTFLELVGDAVSFLSDIEFLEFLEVLEDPIQTLQTGVGDAVDLLKDLDSALDDVRDVVKKLNTPVNDVATVATDLDQHMGVWVRQMNLIDDSVQLAQGVALLVEGSFGDEIEKIVDVYLGVAKDLEQVVSPVVNALEEVKTSVSAAKTELAKLSKPLEPVTAIAKTVESAFDKVSFLKPVLKDLKDALKPVLWVLKAVSCLIKKILDPIIKPILKATGIEKKIKGLFDNLLGISDIKQAVTQAKDAVASGASGFTGAIDDLISKGGDLAKLKGGVVSALDKALDSTFDQQIQMLGEALGKAPKNKNVNVAPFTSGYDKFWGIVANVLNLLKANSTSHDVTVVIDTILGAGNALIEANKNAGLPFRVGELPLFEGSSGPTADEVAFWTKAKAYLEALKANTKSSQVLTMIDTAVGAGDGYFQTQDPGDSQQVLILDNPRLEGENMSMTQTDSTSTTTSDPATFQLVIQVIAELFPAIQAIFALIDEKIKNPAFKVAADTILGAIGGFLKGQGFAINTKYKADIPKEDEIIITLNNINPPTVTTGDGTNIPVTAVPSNPTEIDVNHQKFCQEWPAVEGLLTYFEATVLPTLPAHFRVAVATLIQAILNAGEDASKELCHKAAA